jgi:hypothetical protein
MLRVCVIVDWSPVVCEAVGAPPGSAVEETSAAGLVVPSLVARTELPVRVEEAVDCEDEAVVSPAWTASLRVAPVVDNCVVLAAGASATGDGRGPSALRKAPNAAAVDALTVRMNTTSTDVNAIRDSRTALHRRLTARAGCSPRRLIGPGKSRERR